MKRLSRCICIIISLTALSGVIEESNSQEPEIDEILTNLRSSFAQVKDYIVMLNVRTDIKDVYLPEMKIKAYFKQPDKIHLESTGFAILPREGMFLNPNSIIRDDFYMSILDKKVVNGEEIVRLELVPRKEDIKVRKLILWINTRKWVFSKVDSITWEGRSVIVDFEYVKFLDQLWLPVKAIVTMDMSGFRGFQSFHNHRGWDDSKGKTTEDNKGTVIVDFSEYKINQGIPDSVFDKMEKKP